MLVTLETQRGRRDQQEHSSTTAANQPQPQIPTAAVPPAVPTVAPATTTPTRKPIGSLTRKAATPSSGTSIHSDPVPAEPAAPAVHFSPSQPSHTEASQDEELSASLDQLALNQPVPPARLTPLQALAARPRGSPSASPSRPASDTSAARRLVMGALGIRNERSEEEKDRERQARREHQRVRREQLAAQKQAAATAAGEQAETT